MMCSLDVRSTLTLFDVLLCKPNNHLCQFSIVSSNTPSIPKQQTTEAEGEVGGGFENIGLTYQKRN